MKTEIEILKDIFPQLYYDEGRLFITPNGEEIVWEESNQPVDARMLIDEYYEDCVIVDDDDVYVPVPGSIYIKHKFNSNYLTAFYEI